MAGWFPPAPIIQAEPFLSVPSHLRDLRETEHSRNHRSPAIDCFLEGPVIVPLAEPSTSVIASPPASKPTLFVVDIPYGRILAIDLATKEWSCVIQYDGEPNGMAWHPTLKKILIADRKRGIMALDPLTTPATLTGFLTRFNGEHFRGLNDLIVAEDGTVYFTDQGMSGLQDPSGRVYRHNSTTGRTDIVLRNCPSPNGLLLDREEKVLFVAMTRDNAIWHAPMYPDGSTQRTGRFSSYYGIGGPDGLTMDVEGNLFVCHVSLGTIFVHKPNGEPLARILVGEAGGGRQTTNLTWGGEKGNELFITESEKGLVVRVKWHCRGWLGKIYEGGT